MRGVTVRPKVKEWLVFAAFLVLAIGLRISSFFKTVIDPDETLYLLISREMLRGQVLYTGLWDHKPPGIFAVYAAIQTALGESIFAMRLAACIVVATTCYLLYRLGTFIGGGRERYGLLAGLLYVVYSLNMGGLAANTEIFFTPLITLAFYLLFTAEQYPVRLVGPGSLRVFLIGLLLGLGLQINYVVLFAFVAVALIVGGALYAARKSMTALLKQAFATYALL
ncbi:MAG: ArnT family glycosyltransferase, partial [Anaerolineae bacterium]